MAYVNFLERPGIQEYFDKAEKALEKKYENLTAKAQRGYFEQYDYPCPVSKELDESIREYLYACRYEETHDCQEALLFIELRDETKFKGMAREQREALEAWIAQNRVLME